MEFFEKNYVRYALTNELIFEATEKHLLISLLLLRLIIFNDVVNI